MGLLSEAIWLGKWIKLHYCQCMNLLKSFPLFQLFFFNRKRANNNEKPAIRRASNYSIFKRLLNLSLVIIGVIICIKLWMVHNKQEDLWYQQQASQLGRSMAQLGAQAISQAVVENNEALLTQQISFLINDPYVTGVAVFNQKGQKLQQQDPQSNIVTRYLQSDAQALTFIQEIQSDDKQIVGYLRLVLDEEKLMQFHFDYQQQMIEQFELLLVLAAIAGGIITRAFYTIRYRQYRRKLKEELINSDVV